MSYRETYENLWASGYRLKDRCHTNNYGQIKEALDPSGSLADWGCGQGRVAQMFKDDGLDVVGIDIAHNSLDDDVKIEFICSEIKDAYLQQVDYSMCYDVLEHIDEEDIQSSIANIMEHTNKNAMFKIYMGPDNKIINGKPWNLHVTMKEEEWWLRHFDDYKVLWCNGCRRTLQLYIVVTHE